MAYELLFDNPRIAQVGGPEFLDHDLNKYFPELLKFESSDELAKSAVYQEIRDEAEQILNAVVVDNLSESSASPGSDITALAWNIERGNIFEGIVDALRNHNELKDKDLLLLTELDFGMARSKNRFVAREIAEVLKLNYAFAPVYIALQKGSGVESEMEGENTFSIHGLAMFSKWPMKNVHAGGSIYIWTLGGRKTAHTIAREFGHAEVEQLLWKASDDSLSLTMACELGDDDLVRSLITARPDLVRALQPADVTRIVAAAELRNGEAVKRMLAIGWPAGTVDRGGLTALHWTGFHGDATTARALLAAGAPLDVRDDTHSGTPLGWALWGSVHGWHRQHGDYVGTVQAMLDAGATPPEVTDALVASDEVKRVLAQHRS